MRCRLGEILEENKTNPYALSMKIQHVQSTIYSLASNDYLNPKQRLPVSLLLAICGEFKIGIDKLLEVEGLPPEEEEVTV